MRTIITSSALAAALAFGAIGAADAWERKSSFSGPRGTSTFDASGSCADRSCSRSATATGAQGRTATRSGGANCADGACAGNRTTTGPGGRTATRNSTITR